MTTTPRKPDVTPRVFVGRQPIFRRDQSIYGYELLFRSDALTNAARMDGNNATAQVIHNTLLEIGIDDLVGGHYAFINMPRDILLSGMTSLLPPGRIVIEVLENEAVDEALVKAVAEHAARGFAVALDDFVYSPQWEALLRHATIIKFDVRNSAAEEIVRQLDLMRGHNYKLLAEKVETEAEFQRYRNLGFDYFQGYFFSKPAIVSQDRLPDNHVALLQLLAVLQDPDVAIKEVEKLITQTVTLNYKLFKYLNSAFLGKSRTIQSIHQAIVYLGLNHIRQLASLITLMGVDDKPSELVRAGLVRAKLCELLCMHTRKTNPEAFFIVGLFSILEALMQHPLDQILAKLPLPAHVTAGLLHREGAEGAALDCAIACEQCDWKRIRFEGMDAGELSSAYLDAIKWSTEISTLLE